MFGILVIIFSILFNMLDIYSPILYKRSVVVFSNKDFISSGIFNLLISTDDTILFILFEILMFLLAIIITGFYLFWKLFYIIFRNKGEKDD